MSTTYWFLSIGVVFILYLFLRHTKKHFSVHELKNFKSYFDDNEKVYVTEFDVTFQEGLVSTKFYLLRGQFFSVNKMTQSSVKSILSMTERNTYHALKHGLNSPPGRFTMQYQDNDYSIHFSLAENVL